MRSMAVEKKSSSIAPQLAWGSVMAMMACYVRSALKNFNAWRYCSLYREGLDMELSESKIACCPRSEAFQSSSTG